MFYCEFVNRLTLLTISFFFLRSLLCSSRLHLINQKYRKTVILLLFSNNSYIVTIITMYNIGFLF